MKRPARISSALASLLITGLFAALLAACLSPDSEPIELTDPPADSVTIWPASINVARRGDTLTFIIHGLKRQYACAKTIKVGWDFLRDTTGAEYYRPNSAFEIPADPPCVAEPEGFDTLFRVRVYTEVGKRFHLQTPDGVVTDSVLFVSDQSQVFLETFQHAPGGSDSTVSGRYVFRDSTASHPRRMLHLRTPARCEFLQTALYERRGDTLSIQLRRIRAAVLPDALLPACAASARAADSVEVAPRIHRFP